MTATAAWCGRCGSSAIVLEETLDPRRPIVRCERIPSRTGSGSCGRLVGTRIPTEAERIARRWAGRSATRQHVRHLRAGASDPDCARCREALGRLRPTRGIR